jgi:hypothetical protein
MELDERQKAAVERLEAAAPSRGIDLEAIAAWVESRPVADTERELTAAELEVLEAEGLSERSVSTGPWIEAFGEELRLEEEALDAEAAAKKLGFSASRVRQLLGEHRLYGIKQGRGWILPRWQFRPRGKGAIPGIEEVLEVMPRDLHPLSVRGFMSTPQPELRLAGEAVSPLDWLSSGGDPAPVAALAAEL